MTEARRREAYSIFVDSLDVSIQERTAFLESRCAGDAELRRNVDGLLAAASCDPLATQAFTEGVAPVRESFTGKTFGRFRLLELIGEGGMGAVYRATRTDGMEQAVAIKIIAAGLGEKMRQRFEREAHLLARLEHPSLARLIDVGIDEGRPWIAMEYVRGKRIDEYCQAHDLAAADIVRLLVQLAGAVAAAHAMLVVHSDIKPANVLVTESGVPKLIDFGIAAVLRDADTQQQPTLNLGALFSPNYAAPEQITGGAITVATDVFGLGALAYRLLTGVPLHVSATDPMAYLLAVTQHDAAPPSRAAVQGRNAAIDPRALRGDVDAMICKALERDPKRRYASVPEFEADLTRYLQQRPVSARPASAGYRLGKFIRRNVVAVSLASLLAASLVGGGVFATVLARRALVARDMAARRGEFLENVLTSANPGNGRRDITVAELLDAATSNLDRSVGGEPMVEASMLDLIAETNLSLDRLTGAFEANDRELLILKSQGANASQVGHALVTRAQLFREQGNWGETENAIRDAIKLLRPQGQSTDLCTALDILGITLAHTSREAEAERTLREEIGIESKGSVELRKRLHYPYYALAVMWGELGRNAESLDAARKALDFAKQELPPDHPDVLAIQNTYASTLVNDGQGAAAEPIFRDIVNTDIRVFGPDHKSTLLAQWALADDLVELHRDADAMPIAQTAARGLEGLVGQENLYTWAAWQTYGLAACNHGDYQSGLDTLRRVEAGRRHIYPSNHWAVYSTEVTLGGCLLDSGRYAEAEAILLDGVAGLESVRGSAFARTQAGYKKLRQLYLNTSRPADAARMDAKITT